VNHNLRLTVLNKKNGRVGSRDKFSRKTNRRFKVKLNESSKKLYFSLHRKRTFRGTVLFGNGEIEIGKIDFNGGVTKVAIKNKAILKLSKCKALCKRASQTRCGTNKQMPRKKSYDHSKSYLEYQQEFSVLIENLIDQTKFKQTHGFTLQEYIQHRKNLVIELEYVARYIERVVRDTGYAKIATGGLDILLGIGGLAGLVLAVPSGGTSLVLTGLTTTGDLVATGGRISTEIIKNSLIYNRKQELEDQFKNLHLEEKTINKIFKQLDEKIDELEDQIENNPGFKQDYLSYSDLSADSNYTVNDIMGLSMYAVQGHQASSMNVRKMTEIITKIRGFAKKGKVKPISKGVIKALTGRSLFGSKGLAKVGLTTAKSFASFVFGLDILFGIGQVHSGLKDINGSELAQQYRQFADKYSIQTKGLEANIEAFYSDLT